MKKLLTAMIVTVVWMVGCGVEGESELFCGEGTVQAGDTCVVAETENVNHETEEQDSEIPVVKCGEGTTFDKENGECVAETNNNRINNTEENKPIADPDHEGIMLCQNTCTKTMSGIMGANAYMFWPTRYTCQLTNNEHYWSYYYEDYSLNTGSVPEKAKIELDIGIENFDNFGEIEPMIELHYIDSDRHIAKSEYLYLNFAYHVREGVSKYQIDFDIDSDIKSTLYHVKIYVLGDYKKSATKIFVENTKLEIWGMQEVALNCPNLKKIANILQ